MEHSSHLSGHSHHQHDNHQQHKAGAHHQERKADEQMNDHDAHAGHDKHAGHHTEDFLKRFWICIVLTLPVLLLSEMIQHWFGFHISFRGDGYVLLALGSIIYFYGGMPFLTGMVREIRHRAIGMMTLVALGITGAFENSVAVE